LQPWIQYCFRRSFAVYRRRETLMPISIDSGAMDEAKAKLASMASKDRWLGELAMRVSAGGMKLVADEFKTSTDPYGTPWAPLARPRTRDKRAARRAIAKGKKPRGPQVLVNTGRMRGSAGASPNGQEARVVVPTWYARFHQDGTRFHLQDTRFDERGENMHPDGSVRMPQRMILPREGDLPARWEEMVGRESKTFMAQRFGVEA
jgi:hypothetical protein